MKIQAMLLIAAAATLGACDTYGPPPVAAPLAPAAAPGLTTADKAPFGTYLVDSGGRAVYILDGTRAQNGAYRCSGECTHHWPPVYAATPPVAAAGVNAGLLATIPAYGSVQTTYSGWPLYYYHRDMAPGDTTGQGVHDTWGTWYLLSPSGEPIRPAGGGY